MRTLTTNLRGGSKPKKEVVVAEESLSCDSCGKEYKTEGGLTRHIKTHEQKGGWLTAGLPF